MHVDTLLRALTAVREKIVTADELASDWLAERDRRRRQEAAFLRGIVRAEGSQRKAALVTGMSQSTISRTLDQEGHLKVRAYNNAVRADASKPNDASPDNVIPLAKPQAQTLRDLLTPNKNYWADRRVRDVYLALKRCERFSPDGAAFLYTKGLTQLSHDFSGRMFNDEHEAAPRDEQGIAAGDD